MFMKFEVLNGMQYAERHGIEITEEQEYLLNDIISLGLSIKALREVSGGIGEVVENIAYLRRVAISKYEETYEEYTELNDIWE